MIQSSKNNIDQITVINNQSLHDKNNSIKLKVNFQNIHHCESDDENSIEINIESHQNLNIQNNLDYEERLNCQYNKLIEKHEHSLNDNQIIFEGYTNAMNRNEKEFDIESTYDNERNQKESSDFDKNV